MTPLAYIETNLHVSMKKHNGRLHCCVLKIIKLGGKFELQSKHVYKKVQKLLTRSKLIFGVAYRIMYKILLGSSSNYLLLLSIKTISKVIINDVQK